MIKSMTGFGKSKAELPDKTINIEIKTLNSKQMDIIVRVPLHYKEKEIEIRNLLGQKLNRGKAEVQFWFDAEGEKKQSINTQAAKHYYAQVSALNEELGAGADGKDLLQMIMRMPEIMETERPEISDEEWNVVKSAVLDAVAQLNEFRLQEGSALEKDLIEQIKTIKEKAAQVPAYEAERAKNVRTKLNQSLENLDSATNIDKDRLEQEIVYYLEKFDINEEKVRLANHCEYFLETLNSDQPNGKKLGFISQEIGREINTLGAKANHPEIQKLVVEMKEELEKIKEQILNVL